MSAPPQSVPLGTTDIPPGPTRAGEHISGTQGMLKEPLPVGDFGERQRHILLGVTCMFFILCSASVGGRFLARRMVKLSLGADDYLAVAAMVRRFLYSLFERTRVKLTCIAR